MLNTYILYWEIHIFANVHQSFLFNGTFCINNFLKIMLLIN